jgi:type I restriction enzyme M protein
MGEFVDELERLQALKAALDGKIKAAESSGEEDEEGEAVPDEDAPTEAEIREWKSERAQVNKRLEAKQASFEEHLNEAVDGLDEPAAAALLLTILHNDMAGILERYVRQQRQQVIAVFETWWDKYRVTLRDIQAERDAAARELQGYLEGLGYV